MSATTAESLLAEAERLYRQGQTDYRDVLLRVGMILHQFVLARLHEWSSLGPCARRKNDCTRETAFKEAAARLDISLQQCRIYISTAMAVELLGGGDIGQLAHCAARQFTVFLCRVGVRKKMGVRCDDPIHERETWAVRPEYSESAPALFERAKAEGWPRLRCRQECTKLAGLSRLARPGKHPRKTISATQKERTELDARAYQKASPGDVAEACLKFVLAHEEPWQVAQRLIVELQRIPRKKPNPLLSAYCCRGS